MEPNKHDNKSNRFDIKWLVVCVSIFLVVAILVASCGLNEEPQPIDSGTTTSSTESDPMTTPSSPRSPFDTTSTSSNPWSQDLRDLIESLRPPIVSGKSIPYFARIMRTIPLAPTLGISTNPVLLNNKDDLSSYLQKATCGWQFNEADVEKLLEVYNDGFFDKKVLIVGAIGLNSGSIQVDVKEVIQTDDELTVLFNFIVPDVGTADMMSWHYFVEIAASDADGRKLANFYLPNVGNPTFGVEK